jgi:hypothetical protein
MFSSRYPIPIRTYTLGAFAERADMLDGILFEIRLWQLHRKIAKLESEIDQELEKAKGWEERQEVYAAWDFDLAFGRQVVAELVTRHLRKKCDRWFLPFPSHDEEEMWEEFRATGGKALSRKGIARVRDAIRQERRERYVWAAGLTGVIGALTGLLSVFGDLILR